MLLCRILVLILCIVFLICILCGNILPIFKKKPGHHKAIQTLWYSKGVPDDSKIVPSDDTAVAPGPAHSFWGSEKAVVNTEPLTPVVQRVVPGANNGQIVSRSKCRSFRSFFMAAEAMSLCAIGFGVLILVFSIVQMLLKQTGCCFGCFIYFLNFLALSACCVCLSIFIFAYLRGFCRDHPLLSQYYTSFKKRDYVFGEGFYFFCVCSCLLFVLSFLQCCA